LELCHHKDVGGLEDEGYFDALVRMFERAIEDKVVSFTAI